MGPWHDLSIPPKLLIQYLPQHRNSGLSEQDPALAVCIRRSKTSATASPASEERSQIQSRREDELRAVPRWITLPVWWATQRRVLTAAQHPSPISPAARDQECRSRRWGIFLPRPYTHWDIASEFQAEAGNEANKRWGISNRLPYWVWFLKCNNW